MPLRIDLENPERESGLALDPLDEPSFLPVGMFPASEGEQDLVWGERSDVVLDRCHGGVVADRASHDARAAWDELSEDRVQAFVGLVACPVGVRHQPLDSSGERWRNDEDLFGRFDHGSNVVGQLVQVGYRCAGEHQQAIDV